MSKVKDIYLYDTCIYYFRGKDASASPVCSAMGNLVSYHLGSVVCGSFLITLFKLPRLILTYLYAKYVSLMHKFITCYYKNLKYKHFIDSRKTKKHLHVHSVA